MIRLAVVCALLSTSAAADIWTAFQTRCLAPMERAEDPITPEMTVVQDNEAARVHLLQGNGFELAVTSYKGLEPWIPQSCATAAMSDDAWAGLVTEFKQWEADQLSAEQYEYIGLAAELTLDADAERRWRYGLFSTAQREPKLRVYLMPPEAGGVGIIVVEDTELES